MPDFSPPSPALLIYACIYASAFVIALASLLALRLAKRNVDHALRAVLGWLLIAPPILIAPAFGRVPALAFLTAVALLALREYAKAAALDHCYTLALAAAILATATLQFFHIPAHPTQLFFALALFTIPILYNRPPGNQLRNFALALTAFLLLVVFFSHLPRLLDFPHGDALLLFLITAVGLNDIAAYSFGKALGCHKLRSRISPNKTWEGAIGALAVSMLIPFAFKFSLPHFQTPHLLLTGFIIGIGAPLGDLAVSFIKRELALKDFGATLPGHGGVLDRIDSLLFTAPLFFHLAASRHTI